MTNETELLEDVKPNLAGMILLAIAISVVGGFLAWRFIVADTARDLKGWQERLNLIAESRNAEIGGWVGNHFKELRSLSDNPSLRLYLTELETMRQDGALPEGDSEPAQKSYLRNLLLFTADRMGFAGSTSAASQIPANVEQPLEGALIVTDSASHIVVSTPITSDLSAPLLQKAAAVEAGKEGLIDLYKNDDGKLQLAFVSPIKSIQGEAPLGQIIGMKQVDAPLLALLKHPGITEQTIEAVLLREHDGMLDYLSPLLDGSSALSKTLQEDPKQLAEASAIAMPGSFVQMKDYRGQPVLATARQISGTPWWLVLKIDRAEAMKESNARRASLIGTFALVIVALILLIVTVWWRASSKRSLLLSQQFRRMAERSAAQEQLLAVVANRQDDSIYIVDERQNYRFANEKAAHETGMTVESIIGKHVTDVLGSARAETCLAKCGQVLLSGEPARLEQNAADRNLHSDYIPVNYLPLRKPDDTSRGVLVVEHDITEIMQEREKRIAVQRQLVDTLVSIVDKRDPNAANHSHRVARLAEEVALKMALDTQTVETTKNAGNLMNIGKIIIPSELLTRAHNLDEAEKKTIRESIAASAELLKKVTFDGPVLETLRQLQEQLLDGNANPESLLMPTRIIIAVNAFVAMISPRAWRPAMSVADATKQMLEDADKRYDRKVVIALADYIENQDGKALIEQLAA